MTGGPGPGFWVLAALIAAGAWYAVSVNRLSGRGVRWPAPRSFSWFAGLMCLAAAALPLPGQLPEFPAHVITHLLMAMLAPLLLALSAPITLLLRTSRGRIRSTALHMLHSRPARALMLGPVVVVLEVVGLYGFYLTPLYDLAHHNATVRAVVHLHMFLAGCLLSWYLVAADPMRHRPSLRTSLAVLLVVAAAHDLLGKLMFARHEPAGGGPAADIETGAQLMYHGGWGIELALAVAVLTGWYRRTGRAYRRERAREALPVRVSARPGPRVAPTATPTRPG
jgi:putative membrane protein